MQDFNIFGNMIWIEYGHQNVCNCGVGFIIFVTSHIKSWTFLLNENKFPCKMYNCSKWL